MIRNKFTVCLKDRWRENSKYWAWVIMHSYNHNWFMNLLEQTIYFNKFQQPVQKQVRHPGDIREAINQHITHFSWWNILATWVLLYLTWGSNDTGWYMLDIVGEPLKHDLGINRYIIAWMRWQNLLKTQTLLITHTKKNRHKRTTVLLSPLRVSPQPRHVLHPVLHRLAVT